MSVSFVLYLNNQSRNFIPFFVYPQTYIFQQKIPKPIKSLLLLCISTTFNSLLKILPNKPTKFIIDDQIRLLRFYNNSMSQYQDYFFSDVDQNGEYSMLESPRMNHRNIHGLEFIIDQEFLKQNHATVDPTDVTEFVNPIQNLDQQTENAPKSKKRKKRNINISSQLLCKRKQVMKGLKDDTTELNTNFKTILTKHLKQISILKEVDKKDIELIQQFIRSVPSFSGMKILVRSLALKRKLLKLIKCPKIVYLIMKSQGSIENKLTMLKYLQNLKENFQCQRIVKWKDIGES